MLYKKPAKTIVLAGFFFNPQTYYQIKVTAEKNGIPFSALSEHKYETLPAANTALSAVTATGTVTVAEARCKEVSQGLPQRGRRDSH